jgi:L-aminopeptidase/D-esterase-like protein
VAVRAENSQVAALAVVNAVGDVFTLEGEPLTGGSHAPGPPAIPPVPHSHTTLVVVATDAALSRTELAVVAVRSHDAIAACLRPAHTRYDGDTVFAASCGMTAAAVDAVAEAAFEAVGRSIEMAVRAGREEAGSDAGSARQSSRDTTR